MDGDADERGDVWSDLDSDSNLRGACCVPSLSNPCSDVNDTSKLLDTTQYQMISALLCCRTFCTYHSQREGNIQNLSYHADKVTT